MYSLFWRDPSLPFAQKQAAISVPAGQIVSDKASIRFTGKGAANYGKVLQENQMRLLESFAGPIAPDYPTVGQTWFDSTNNLLKVCISTAPSDVVWRSLNGVQVTEVGDEPPSPAVLGDEWFQRTGPLSGFKYIYTGTGRYPEVTWNRGDFNYYPSNSTTLACKANYDSLTTQNFGEAYICGFTGGNPSDTDGTILRNGNQVVVPRGRLTTSHPVKDGFIVWDTTGTMVVPNSTEHFFVVRQLDDGTFEYDNNNSWQSVTPAYGMNVIGLINVSEADDGNAPGISSVQLWSEARELQFTQSVPFVQTYGAIGGWEQVYPEKIFAAGRDEYNYLLSLLSQLIGSTTVGGCGAIGRSVDYLTPFKTLDASLQNAYLTNTPYDQQLLAGPVLLNLLTVQPNSQDWDRLLAAAKYAVNRLELPPNTIDDISELPFVLDGRQAPDFLLQLEPDDPRFITYARAANARVGTITLARLYQETVNTLLAAIANRYILKGMQGTSGTNTSFNDNVDAHYYADFVANANGSSFAATVSHGLQFTFATTDVDLQRFFMAGQAIELIVQTEPGSTPTTADINLQSVCNQYGRFRVTQDAVYVMTNSVTPALSLMPGSIGVGSLTTTSQVLATAAVGGASLVLRGNLVVPSGFLSTDAPIIRLYVDIVAGGATTGFINTTWNVITDDETYNGTKRVFPVPLPPTPSSLLGNTAGLALFGNQV